MRQRALTARARDATGGSSNPIQPPPPPHYAFQSSLHSTIDEVTTSNGNRHAGHSAAPDFSQNGILWPNGLPQHHVPMHVQWQHWPHAPYVNPQIRAPLGHAPQFVGHAPQFVAKEKSIRINGFERKCQACKLNDFSFKYCRSSGMIEDKRRTRGRSVQALNHTDPEWE